ncbi:MAG: glycosyltransferase family 9 protein [Endomicrobia bacterium]|nr:glycosyltransferase family 9 protein [Endomicrobiia bacterium]
MEKKEKFSVHTDCIRFPLDRPCVYQKNDNARCAECDKYSKVSQNAVFKILIIKLGAMGDVLRTTFLLEGLKELYPASEISWIVSKNNAQVLSGNKFINNIIINDDNTAGFLTSNYFNLVINPDLAPKSLALARLSFKENFSGYVLDNDRNIVFSNEPAQQWLLMSSYDELKKANQHTYQHWMSAITGLNKDNYEIIVPLQESSVKKADIFLKEKNIAAGKKIIGINPGAGKRWKMKKWRTDGFIALAKHLSSKGHIVLLLGGNDDIEEITAITNEKIKNVYSAGTDNSIPDFFALVNLCDIIVCGDTMALHAAAGLKKNIVALFGPTSLAEIDVYGRGIKLQSNKECICCYKQECDISKNCMDLISEEEVIKAVEKYL